VSILLEVEFHCEVPGNFRGAFLMVVPIQT
jgi:hypothetical protein